MHSDRRSVPVLLAAGAAALLALVAACSSEEPAVSKPPASQSTAPEDLRASDAEVAAGLGQLRDLTAQIAATTGSDKSSAQSLVEEIEPIWERIEGTVKANDADAYIAFEDAFAAIGKAVDDGDTAKAQDAAGQVRDAADRYLAAHPG